MSELFPFVILIVGLVAVGIGTQPIAWTRWGLVTIVGSWLVFAAGILLGRLLK